MKKQFMVFLTILLIILVGLTGCTQNNNTPPTLSYQNKKFGFGLNPPQGWFTNESKTVNSVVFTPPTGDTASANFVVLSTPSMNQSIETFILVFLKMIKNNTQYAMVKNETIVVGGQTAYEVGIIMNVFGQDMKQWYIFLEKGDTIYSLIYSAVPDVFNNYLTDVQTSIDSFTLL